MSLSFNHSYICTKILKQLINTDFEPLVELTLDIEGGLTPDISVYKETAKPDFLEDQVKYGIMPILAIEILSPSQNIPELVSKAKKMLEAGISWVWIVDTYARTVIVMGKESHDTVHKDVVDSGGIKVDFKEIFF
ncbi:MAG: Uma2 family endonuclease [Desulfobacteraceae bacterium]|nr:Uma2 family endonuclease [Desulfobacteraceae bacterium]